MELDQAVMTNEIKRGEWITFWPVGARVATSDTSSLANAAISALGALDATTFTIVKAIVGTGNDFVMAQCTTSTTTPVSCGHIDSGLGGIYGGAEPGHPNAIRVTHHYNRPISKTSVRLIITTPEQRFQVDVPGEPGYVGRTTTIPVTIVNGLGLSGLPSFAITQHPYGDKSYTTPKNMYCTLVPQQLTTLVEPAEVDFGLIQINQATAGEAEVRLKITSGSSQPSGTIRLSSPNFNTSGRIALGGGEVQVINSATGKEIVQRGYADITSRDMSFLVKLNSVGATPGAATSTISFDMTVN